MHLGVREKVPFIRTPGINWSVRDVPFCFLTTERSDEKTCRGSWSSSQRDDEQYKIPVFLRVRHQDHACMRACVHACVQQAENVCGRIKLRSHKVLILVKTPIVEELQQQG